MDYHRKQVKVKVKVNAHKAKRWHSTSNSVDMYVYKIRAHAQTGLAHRRQLDVMVSPLGMFRRIPLLDTIVWDWVGSDE